MEYAVLRLDSRALRRMRSQAEDIMVSEERSRNFVLDGGLAWFKMGVYGCKGARSERFTLSKGSTLPYIRRLSAANSMHVYHVGK